MLVCRAGETTQNFCPGNDSHLEWCQGSLQFWDGYSNPNWPWNNHRMVHHCFSSSQFVNCSGPTAILHLTSIPASANASSLSPSWRQHNEPPAEVQWNPLAFRISETPPLNTPRGWHACDIISTHWDLILPHPKHQQKKHFKTKCLGLSETRIRPNLMIYHHWGYTGIPHFLLSDKSIWMLQIHHSNLECWVLTNNQRFFAVKTSAEERFARNAAACSFSVSLSCQLRQLGVESFRFSFRIFFTKHE